MKHCSVIQSDGTVSVFALSGSWIYHGCCRGLVFDQVAAGIFTETFPLCLCRLLCGGWLDLLGSQPTVSHETVKPENGVQASPHHFGFLIQILISMETESRRLVETIR